jgi:hypothetical protein
MRGVAAPDSDCDSDCRRGNWWRVATCLLLAIGVVSPPSSAYAETPLESAVKAAFIYKFAPYVNWPPSVFPSPNSPISICVAGDDAVSALIDQAVAGQHVGVRPIVVHHLPTVTSDASCQILYIAEANPQSLSNDLNITRSAPVLTITDSDRTPGFAGVISFTIQDSHVRFNVDDAAAANSGLTISSKLLDLAYTVKHRP